jgi:hypothetical protein
MALTKKQLRRLEEIRYALSSGVAYLRKPTIAVCIKGSPATTTYHAVRPLDGVTLYEVEKEMGSELCMAFTALHSLEKMIEEERPA